MPRGEKDAEESAASALNELKSDLEREIDDIRTTLREKGPAAAEESIEILKGEFNRRLAAVRAGLDKSLKAGRRTVREYPLMMVGVALTVGILIGLAIERAMIRD